MNPQAAALPRRAAQGYFASHWRSLDYFNLYRLTLALALVFTGLLFDSSELFSPGASERYLAYAYAYLIGAALFVLGIRARWPGFQIQLSAHIVADILFTVALMSTSERLAGGLGLLLAISVASGGLVGSGRLTLLYASLASIALLTQQAFSVLESDRGTEGFFQVGLLCAGYFAIGWLSNALTTRALRSEQLAQQQAAELALLDRINALAVESSPEGLLALTGNGLIRHMTPRARALLNVSGSVMPGRTRLVDCSPGLARALPTLPLPGSYHELSLSGTRLRVRCIPVSTQDDTRILMLEDLSVAEAAAQRIKLAALGRLTANIAHEIRNPLAAISQAAQLLQEEPGNPAQAKLSGIIENNARRLDRLVEEVLTLNRRDRLKPVRFNAEALQSLIDELRHAEGIPEDAVIVEIPATLYFSFDPDHLRQILWNLLRNAWRYSHQQPGCLRVEVHSIDNTAHVDIVDDGPGIASDHQGKLFEPFFTTDAQGTGLGLFLARELAMANRAALGFVPEGPGTRFRLSLDKGE